jgi:predicted TPR repeat methyltransferase
MFERLDSDAAQAFAEGRFGDAATALTDTANSASGATPWVWVGWAELRRGDIHAAHAAADKALAQGGGDLATRLLLSALASRDGARMTALDWARRAEVLVPDDAVVEHVLRGLGDRGFDAPLQQEVIDLFDNYAPTFDTHLVETLGYRGHATLPETVAKLSPPPDAEWLVVDLGCGTGLCGPVVRPWARRLVGSDVSPAMVEAAKSKGIYDAVFVSDLVLALATQPDTTVDLYLAADVFGYVGPLDAVFREAARGLVVGGRLAFSVEATQGTGWTLSPARRATYSEAYLRGLAAAHGLTVACMDPTALREEAGSPVPAWVVVLQRA